MTTKTRAAILLTLGTAAVAASLVGARSIDPAVAVGGTQEAAWALLAEADELCRGPRGVIAGGSGRQSPVRSAAAGEALELVRELAGEIRDAGPRRLVLDAARATGRSCQVEPLAEAEWSLSSKDGAAGADRRRILTPYLERLNVAANFAASDRRFGPRRWRATLAARAGEEADGNEDRTTGRLALGESELPDPEPGSFQPSGEAEPPRIVFKLGTAEYRRRVERWRKVFRREAGALRSSRRELQTLIDALSLAESTAGCRAFGAVVAGLDAELVEAPSRELSIRLVRMLDDYLRGAAECSAGRPVSAFGYLSEGDREWAAVAAGAARLFEPRPVRRRAISRAGASVQAKSPSGH